ncbi:hypothetical protein D3C81_1696990 [compost metagenome]
MWSVSLKLGFDLSKIGDRQCIVTKPVQVLFQQLNEQLVVFDDKDFEHVRFSFSPILLLAL